MSSATKDSNFVSGITATNTTGGTSLDITTQNFAGVHPIHAAIVDGSGVQITSFGGGASTADGSTFVTNTTSGTLSMGVYQSTPDTLTTGKSGAIAIDINRNVKTVGNSAAGATDSGAPVKVGGKYNSTLPTLTDGQRGDNQLDAKSIVMMNNAYKLDSTNDSVTVVQPTSSNLKAVVDFSGTGTGTVQLWDGAAGVNNRVRLNDTSGNGITSNSTTFTSKFAPDSNLLGTLGTAFSTAGKIDIIGSVTPVPLSNSGWSFFYVAGGINATKQQIKAVSGTLGGWAWLYNPNTAATFLQIFNKASASVTVGTTAPDFVIVLPGIAAASATGSAANNEIVMGIAMSTGITIAATTTETGLTNPTNPIFCTFLYK